MCSRPRGSHGFTLIEVLVAMAVFGIGTLAFLALQTAILTSRMHAQLMTTATQLTIEQLNTFMLNVPATNDSQTVTCDGTQYTETWTVGSNGNGLTTLTVTTSWKQKGSNDDSVTLSAEVPS